MAKTVFTDRDIEELAQSGTLSLVLGTNDVLTDLAFEKAKRLGIQILQSGDEKPPSAPERPYLSGQSESQTIPVGTSGDFCPPRIGRDALTFIACTDEAALREAIIETGKYLYQSGLMVSNDGNISVRLPDGNILITPSGVSKGRITAQDLIVINMDGKLVKAAADPALKPTSEQPMHLEVYRQRLDVRAIIHTHLIYANALAISLGKIRMDVIPEAAIAFGDIPITDFSLPSSPQNAEAIRNLIKDHDVMLIRNHGSLAVGKDLDEALINQERLEHVAKTLTYAELLGDVNTLPPEMLKKISEIVSQSHKNR
jgi:L-fuculose-phosphate aldolase